MYENGEGTKVNRAEAMNWLLRSGISGNPNASAEARKLRASMSDAEWKATQKKLRAHNFDLTKIGAFLEGTDNAGH
jgi:TPR repeat protein